VIWYAKLFPTEPDALAALVTTGGPGATVIVTDAVPVPQAFVALIVMTQLPAAAGVPEMTPVLAFMFSPEGSPLAP
jgi:hypothetical protein